MRGIPIEFELEKAVNFAKREITAYLSTKHVDRQLHRVMPTALDNSVPRIKKGEIPFFQDHKINVGTIIKGGSDSTGFLAVGYVSKTREGDDLLEKVRDGSSRACSFSGPALPNRWEVNLEKGDDGVERAVVTFHEIKLREGGPCVDLFPVNENAQILAVKALSEDELDILYDLPYVVKSFILGRKTVTGEEERIARAALRAYESLGENVDLLKAMLAPGGHLAPPKGDADSPTPAEAEKKHPDLTPLLESLRQRGRIAA